jgi:Flp pilus assembly protein TadD
MTTESKATAPAQGARSMSGPEMIERALKGFQAYEKGHYDEARAVFVELAAYDPTEGYYRTALGAISLAVDELDEALEHFDEALRLNPTDCPALINRGEVHLRLGNIMQAAQDFSRVVGLDPENKDPLTERARVLAAAALQSAEEAQRDFGGGSAEG